ncbi:hypothetical protein NEUTE1DRAFT_118421 [Neurospora tetrasperma FGSC 2508]|uniref:Uncharacterized protein n=1 Tax=Neurospora tetrasperma (strain FGSC 2508 / ATCC MYA-4615 / P0657) TaxID=510951 RepID=F8MY11_NEUT8|nr:uncharacterized protein NEUTE1DRAFT_118421 [Neurospora tetrasperma FGSC 2508]EGO51493.1 hypothetical protein NEUTE1DRAFT_118421 [Neurospora tetrasperma FGSC 2508]EGZ78521.1 hypothetical protein NEUTE2DRAFT_143241 [Neurospora tetrasperma FGSC 2509]
MAGGDDLSKKEVNILPHDTQKDEQKNPNNPLNKLADSAKATFEQASKAMPGPAISQNIGGEEGTKEERRAKAEELNK